MRTLAHLKFLPRLLIICGAFLAALPLTLLAHAPGYTDWNAGRDLALNEKPDGGAQESVNPNATIPQWSYGYRTGIENTNLTLYTAAEHLNVTDGIYAGYEGYGDTAQQYGAGVHIGTDSYTFSGLETLAPDEVFTSVDDHSTDGNNVIRWTCPANGTYSYRVAWRDLDSRGGDGAAGYVVINGVQKFKGTWANGSGQGSSTTGTVTLNAGDVFDVLLNANSADSSYDTAGTRVVIVPGSVLPPQTLSLSLTTAADGKLDLGTFNGGASVTLAFSGNGDLVDSRYQTRPDGSLYAPASGGYEFANAGAAYPTQDGGDGINHFAGGGANYDATGSGYGFAGKLTTDTTDPAAIRNGAVVGTFSASPARDDWFLIGNGATVTIPVGGTHLYVAVNDTVSGDNHGAYTGTLSATGDTPNNGGLVVPGTANPFLAGQPEGTTASGGDDSAPGQSPVLVPGLTLNPGKPLNFAVTGSVSTDAALPPTTGPDGAYFFAHDAENGFPKLIAPINSLVGVFLSDTAPDPTSVNGTVRDFSDAASGGVNYLGYQPRLAEAFFIGDGQTSGGALQNVYPPAGATRLFLGVLDGNDYFNNLGQFNVVVTPSALDASDVRLGQSVGSPTSDSGGSALIGDKITYTFHLKNVGSRTLTNVVVRDVLPGVLEPVSISDGGTFQGGVITWSLGTLAPTGASVSRDLTLVVRTFAAGDSGQNVAAARVNQVVNNLDYSFTGDGLPPAVAGLDLNNPTTLLSPVSVAFTSNSANVAPGGTLAYTVDIANTSADKARGVKFTVPIPALLKNVDYYFVDANGTRLTALDANATLDGSGITFKVGGIKAGQHVYVVITGYVPFDVDPSGAFALATGQLTLKNSDGFGQNAYNVEAPATVLTGATVAPPSLTLAKVIPNGPSLVGFLKLPKVAKQLLKTAPELPIFRTDASGKRVLDDAATLAYGDSLNPSIGIQDDEDGFFTTLALPKPGKPATTVTVALFYNNSGGADAANLVIRDPVPEGFTYLDGSLLLNGKFGKVVSASVENNGRLLVISPGKVKAGDSGLLLYTLTLDDNHPAAGTVLPTRGAQLLTSSLTNSVNAFLDGPNLLLVGNFFVQTEPTVPDGVHPPVNGVVTYDLLYTNTGGKKIKDLQVSCSVPAGVQYLRAVTLRPDKTETVPAGQKDPNLAQEPAAGATSGQILFNLGKLKVNGQGRVRVQYTLTGTPLANGIPDIPNPFVISDGTAPATALAEMRRIALAKDQSPRLHTHGLSDTGDYVLTTPVVRTSDPAVPRIFLVQTVPLAVDPGQTFDYLITVGNLSDNPLGTYYADAGLNVTLPLPDDFDTVKVSGFSTTPHLTPGAHRELIFGVNNVLGHTCSTAKVTVRLKASATGKTVNTTGAHLSSFRNFPGLSAGPVTIRVAAPNQLKVQAADITAAAVARFGATAANVPNVAQNLTYRSTATSVVGADYVSFTNGALLVPLGNGGAFLSGKADAIATSGFIDQTGSTGTIAATDLAGKQSVRNLGGVAPSGQRSVVLDATGRSVQTILQQIVASNPSNVVAKYGASINIAGGLNLCGAKGGTFISNEPAPPPPVAIQPSVLSAGGLALAAGIDNTALAVAAGTLPANASLTVTPGGHLVAAGAGNLIAAGAGNVMSSAGGGLIAAGAGNASPLPSLSLISNDGSGLISQDGSGLISQDGSGLISNDGSGVISRDDAGLVAAGAGN